MTLLHAHGDERDALAALLFEASTVSGQQAAARVAELDDEQVTELFAELVGERANRRHRPGRGLESLHYRFEIVSDYGAFRDLQRHRMLTVQWQSLTPDLGADVPEELDDAGVGDEYRGALERSAETYRALTRPCGRLRAVPRLPDPLRARAQRPRGDARDRAALGRARATRATARSPTSCIA